MLLSFKAQLITLAGVALLSFGAGSTVQGWRLGAKHANALIAKDKAFHELELKLSEQNGSIELLNYKTEQAKSSAKTAWARLAVAEKASVSRVGKAGDIKATTCSAMVEQLKVIPR